MKALLMKPKTEQDLTPAEFIELIRTNRDVIRSSKIIPPKLGEKGFGKIRVTRKTPVYMTGED